MANAEEKAIIDALRAGGILRLRAENELWKLYASFINWGTTKYQLSRDEVRYAYDITICAVIKNIVSGKYKEDTEVLLKAYVARIFHFKCIDVFDETINPKNNTHPDEIESLASRLPDPTEDVIKKIIKKEDHLKMKRCLNKIGEACKEILILFANDYKDSDISVIRGYKNADVVKQTRYRCLDKFYECFLKN